MTESNECDIGAFLVECGIADAPTPEIPSEELYENPEAFRAFAERTVKQGSAEPFNIGKIVGDTERYKILQRQAYILSGEFVRNDGLVSIGEKFLAFARLAGPKNYQLCFQPLNPELIGELIQVASLMHPEMYGTTEHPNLQSEDPARAKEIALKSTGQFLDRYTPQLGREEKIFLSLADAIRDFTVEDARELIDELTDYAGLTGLGAETQEVREQATIGQMLEDRINTGGSEAVNSWNDDLKLDGSDFLARNLFYLMIDRVMEDGIKTKTEERVIDWFGQRFKNLLPEGTDSFFSPINGSTMFKYLRCEHDVQNAIVNEVGTRLLSLKNGELRGLIKTYIELANEEDGNERGTQMRREGAFKYLLQKTGIVPIPKNPRKYIGELQENQELIAEAATYHPMGTGGIGDAETFLETITDATIRGVFSYLTEVELATEIWEHTGDPAKPENILAKIGEFYGLRDRQMSGALRRKYQAERTLEKL